MLSPEEVSLSGKKSMEKASWGCIMSVVKTNHVAFLNTTMLLFFYQESTLF